MNDNEIYKLINDSFEDKIKLDFEDVKKRIAALPEKNDKVISIAPSRSRNNIIYIISAVAACLICAVSLTVIFTFINSGSAKKSESYFSYSAAESAMYEEPAYNAACDESAETFGAVYEDSCMVYDDFEVLTECIKEEISPSDALSDSDLSSTDLD